MTMRIMITNDDQTRKLRVKVRELSNGVPVEPLPSSIVEVEPKGSHEVWLHQGRDCLLEEV